MSRLASWILGFLLLTTMAAAHDASQTPSLPKRTSDIRTVYLINADADMGVFDEISAEVKAWGHWKIVEQPEQADLLLILSEYKETDALMPHPRTIFELYAPYHWPTATEIDTLTLAAVDRAADRQLLTVSCSRHRLPKAPEYLVSRLRKKIEKRERSGK